MKNLKVELKDLKGDWKGCPISRISPYKHKVNIKYPTNFKTRYNNRWYRIYEQNDKYFIVSNNGKINVKIQDNEKKEATLLELFILKAKELNELSSIKLEVSQYEGYPIKIRTKFKNNSILIQRDFSALSKNCLNTSNEEYVNSYLNNVINTFKDELKEFCLSTLEIVL